jgi:hypothetical protein
VGTLEICDNNDSLLVAEQVTGQNVNSKVISQHNSRTSFIFHTIKIIKMKSMIITKTLQILLQKNKI